MPYRTSGFAMCVQHPLVVAGGACDRCGHGLCESCSRYLATRRCCDDCARVVRRRARRRLALQVAVGALAVVAALLLLAGSISSPRYCFDGARTSCFSGPNAAEDFYRAAVERQLQRSNRVTAHGRIHVAQKDPFWDAEPEGRYQRFCGTDE